MIGPPAASGIAVPGRAADADPPSTSPAASSTQDHWLPISVVSLADPQEERLFTNAGCSRGLNPPVSRARADRADGVHPAHRGHGYGRAITVAAARALQELGSSSVVVCTPSSNVGAVATYQAAGLKQLPERRDLYRDDS
ncbi:GNAT family N-acetyltransferase [Micromonospora sp. NPDC002717]|uniref:GNAT family N-acetyltransferase n=1 Tax=Micromonospora sp. NPDC002717 TaxID=3154424 RepID=UPI003322EC1E